MAKDNVIPGMEQTRSTHRPPARGKKHMAVSGHAMATHAAMRILDKGGNAIDAGVAGTICLAVLQPDMVSFAGVSPIIIHDARSGETCSISGLGWWPEKASTEYFIEHHEGKLPMGILRTVVPALPDACIQALRKHGTMTFDEVMADALDLATNGFPVHQFLHNGIREAEEDYRIWSENREIFLPEGAVPKVGSLFVQKDLGSTFEAMRQAEQDAAAGGANREEALSSARNEFYTGSIGRKITDFHLTHGGLLRQQDMADFSSELESPLAYEFGDFTVLTTGAWSQGPVLPMTLNTLQGMDLTAMGHNSVEYIHTIAEALKLSFADRERLFGDPHFVDVPLAGLLSKEYGALRRKRIRNEAAWEFMPPSDDPFAVEGRKSPASFQPQAEPKVYAVQEHALDTSYICVSDQWGSFFSSTPSDMSFNTQIIPGTGLAVSSRGTQSWIVPGHPSCVAPRKRPRLTPTGCLVLRKGKPWLMLGTPGEDMQCQSNLQVLLNIILFGMDPQEAVEAPRFGVFCHPNSFYPHMYTKGVLSLESRIPKNVAKTLGLWGHKLRPWPEWAWKAGGVCVIMRDDNTITGGADPRRECCGMAW